MKTCKNKFCPITYNEHKKPCIDCRHNKEIDLKEGQDIMDFLQGFGENEKTNSQRTA